MSEVIEYIASYSKNEKSRLVRRDPYIFKKHNWVFKESRCLINAVYSSLRSDFSLGNL